MATAKKKSSSIKKDDSLKKESSAKKPAKKKVSEDYVFYKSDRVLVCDCSKKKFPEGCPMWVVSAIANHIIMYDIPEGMDEKHWFMISGEDKHITLLDTGRMYLTLYHGKYEPIPKVVMEVMLITTKQKVSRKKKDEE